MPEQTSPVRLRAVAPPPLLEVRGASYASGRSRLLHQIDLSVTAGRRLVILGPNGAGKSLLLRLMHGLIPASAGEILWHGRRLDRAARHRQAMVFQRPVLLRRSVLANLRFALSVRGIGGAERATREAEALEEAHLGALARRPARVLSVGEQQRVAMARALACKPELLLLDEATASLDPAATLEIEKLVRRANDDGVTVVMVTHDIGQARRLAQDAAFLHDGRVTETGPADAVLSRPRSHAARAWIEGRLLLPGSSGGLPRPLGDT